MGLVRTLFEGKQEHAPTALPEGLRDLYGGDLQFPASPAQRPYVIGNFVCTLDGVVSFKVKGQGVAGARRIGGARLEGSRFGSHPGTSLYFSSARVWPDIFLNRRLPRTFQPLVSRSLK
jgi:hypothetical protein